MLRLININPSTPSNFPVILINSFKLLEPRSEQAHVTTSERSESDSTIQRDAVFHGVSPCDPEPQIVTDLGLLIFQISNKMSRGNSYDDRKLLSKLGNTLKTVALTSSSWKGLLTAGGGPTSMSLIEQLFHFSITVGDVTLAKLMLQVGADPNQQIWHNGLGICVSALDFAVRSRSDSTVELLLNAGADIGQRSLEYAIISNSLNTADRLLRSDPSLDLNFNYLNDLEHLTSRLQPLKFETVNLLGLVCLGYMDSHCICDDRSSAAMEHEIRCPRIQTLNGLTYLLEHQAVITLDTMILASFSGDIITLQFLIQCGGNVRGVNKFGFSCLDGAILSMKWRYDLFELLLRSGATVNVPQNHNTFGSHASPLHRLLLYRLPKYETIDHRLLRFSELMVQSGADVNYRIRHLGSTSELDEAHERFLWSPHSEYLTPMDLVVQAKAESLLEYAIITGHENIALRLIEWGCQLTGREFKLSVKFGLLYLLKELSKYGLWGSDKEVIGRTCLRLALRWGHEMIVQFLLGDGVNFGKYDMIDALQYAGTSPLSTKTQIGLIHATPDLDRREIFGLPLLELCCLKFSAASVRELLEQFPAAYDSGALCAIVLRALKYNGTLINGFRFKDIEAMLSRRTESNCDWEKENRALLIAAMFMRPGILRTLVNSDTAIMSHTARLPKDVFYWIFDQGFGNNPFEGMDPTYILGHQDWVACSPLIALVTTRNSLAFENMLDHLLACSYEPDALTIVLAAKRGDIHILRRFQYLKNWRRIVSIDDHGRPPWCPTALQVAASDGNEELVELLLDAGVSVNEKPADQPIGELMPRTALQVAIEKGNLRFIDLFIEHRADINAEAAEDSGATALQLACIHGNLDLSLRLLELGADPNAKGALRRGRTALEGAAEHGRIDTMQLLLNYGVGTDGLHREQYIKAIVHAERNQNFAAVALLKEHREWAAEDEECYQSLQSYEWCDI